MRLLAPLAAAALLAGTGCAATRTVVRSSPLSGKTLEVAAKGLDGKEVRVSPPRGARAVVVDFWATWCEPCREQLPFLSDLAARYREEGVQVYAVSFDEDRAAVDAFLAQAPVGFPVLWDRGGAALADRLEITRLPTTLVLDEAGTVRAVHLGYDRPEGDSLERDLRAVLGR